MEGYIIETYKNAYTAKLTNRRISVIRSENDHEIAVLHFKF
jgi:hypothetical protein